MTNDQCCFTFVHRSHVSTFHSLKFIKPLLEIEREILTGQIAYGVVKEYFLRFFLV
jgi:hypothetical protein